MKGFRLWLTVPLMVTPCLSLTFSSSASAAMIYQSARRSISAGGEHLDDSQEMSYDFDPFQAELLDSAYVRDENRAIVGSATVTATQTSTLQPRQIRGLGRGSAFSIGPTTTTASSDMFVEFEITEPTQLVLAGQLRLAAHGPDYDGFEAFIRLSGPEGVVFEVLMDEDHRPNATGVIDFTGRDRMVQAVDAGQYVLEAMSMGLGSSGVTRCADYDFTLSALAVAIPEPSGAVLLALGLLCSARRFGPRRRSSIAVDRVHP